MYDVIPYPENDRALINDFIDDIKKSGNDKVYKDLRKYLKKLSEHGFYMNTKFKTKSIRKIEKDMYELRPDNFRILFTSKADVFYILNGFLKTTQKTPKAEKDKARKYIKEIHKQL